MDYLKSQGDFIVINLKQFSNEIDEYENEIMKSLYYIQNADLISITGKEKTVVIVEKTRMFK